MIVDVREMILCKTLSRVNPLCGVASTLSISSPPPAGNNAPRPSHSRGAGGWAASGGSAAEGASSSSGLEDPGPCTSSHEGICFLLVVSGKLSSAPRWLWGGLREAVLGSSLAVGWSPGSCPRLLAGCGVVSGSNDAQALWDAAARGAVCPARVTWLLHGMPSSGLSGVELRILNLNRVPFTHQPGTHVPRSFPPPPRALLRPCWLCLAWSWALGESRPRPPVQGMMRIQPAPDLEGLTLGLPG